MEHRTPSKTAYAVARMRADHQILDGGQIFSDPYACAILGEQPEQTVMTLKQDPNGLVARTYMASRSRIGEDWLGAACDRGVRQAVILGAGFDTFGLRNPYPDLAVFEVDHPATQDWKRERLAAAGLAVPPSLSFTPVDFTKDELIPSLRKAGFDAQRPAFFLWLGVVPYLTEQNVFATLSAVAAIPGAEVVFDYSEPLENYSAAQRPYIEAMAQKVSAAGEPWLSYFDPDTLATKLRELGFTEIEDLDRNAVVARVSDKQSQERAVGPHLVRARRAG